MLSLNNNPKRETWLVLSLTLFLLYAFIGAVAGDQLPNWLPWFLLTIINLLLSIYFNIINH